MRTPNYDIVQSESNDEWLTIRDVGPWNKFPTITNGAELVVAELVKANMLRPGQRLAYYDNDGHKDEIIVNDQRRFGGFALVPRDFVPSPGG